MQVTNWESSDVVTIIGRVTVVDSAVQTHAFRFLPRPGAAPSVVHNIDAVEVSDEDVVGTLIVEKVTVEDSSVVDEVLALECSVEACVGHARMGASLLGAWEGDKSGKIEFPSAS